MLKKSLFFIVFLIAISGGILLMQWIGYEKTSKAFPNIRVNQEIQLEHHDKGLFIKHTFTGLEAEEPLSVVMPASALEASCQKKEGTCAFRGQSVNIVPKGERLSISYFIKMPAFHFAFVLSDWFIKSKEAKVGHTILHLTDEKIRKGMWFSSLGASEVKKLDLIDYYLFQGTGNPGELYWQPTPLKQLEAKEKLVVYGESKSGLDQQQLHLFQQALVDQAVIILTNEHPAYSSDRLIIVKNSGQFAELMEAFITKSVMQNYHFKEGEEWLGYVMIAYKLDRPVGSEKVKIMYNQLNEQLTDQEREEWENLLFGLTKGPITAEQLDDTLSAVKGLNTSFFAKNKNANKRFQPLFFYDSRSVIINGKETNLQTMVQDGQLFFPFMETTQALGYEIKEVADDKSLLVKRGYNTFRFSPGQNRFILNEEHYGLYEKALQTYDGQLYINEKWLQKVFLVSVQNDKNIQVQDLNE
ncbi:stalk domain-containing protein [Bacillus sp. B190/17]|uniref:Stalk domain-containing protein n=1 Tax=Bacillus lumedeiriae TaxID=3058829 RepID=A0ABW8I609_9BACI